MSSKELPKKSRKYQLEQRVICVNRERENEYLEKGTIRYIGAVRELGGDYLGIEFDNLVRSEKEFVKIYFKCKPKFGDFLKIEEVMKLRSEDFNLEEFKEFLDNKNPKDHSSTSTGLRVGLPIKNKDNPSYRDSSTLNLSNEESQEKPTLDPSQSKECHAQDIKLISTLKEQLLKSKEENENLKNQLKNYQNTEKLNSKFESLFLENEQLKVLKSNLELESKDLKNKFEKVSEQLEIYELEAEIEAREGEAPLSFEEANEKYILIKHAFERLESKYEEEKINNELQIEEMKENLSVLQEKCEKGVGSEKLLTEIKEKDQELNKLKKTLEDYIEAQEVSSGLFDQLQDKSKQIEELNVLFNNQKEQLSNTREQVIELEEIISEMEENSILAEQRIGEREMLIEQQNEQIRILEEQLSNNLDVIKEKNSEQNTLEERLKAVSIAFEQKNNNSVTKIDDSKINYKEYIHHLVNEVNLKRILTIEKYQFQLDTDNKDLNNISAVVSLRSSIKELLNLLFKSLFTEKINSEDNIEVPEHSKSQLTHLFVLYFSLSTILREKLIDNKLVEILDSDIISLLYKLNEHIIDLVLEKSSLEDEGEGGKMENVINDIIAYFLIDPSKIMSLKQTSLIIMHARLMSLARNWKTLLH